MRLSFSLFFMLSSYAVDGFSPTARSGVVHRPPSALMESSEAGVDVGLGEVKLTYTPTPEPKLPAEVIAGIHLPEGKVPKAIDNVEVNKVVDAFAASVLFNINGYLLPSPLTSDKTRQLTVPQEIMKKNAFYELGLIKAGYEDVANYKFFGGDNYVKSLSELLKTNPFWTSALTPKDGGGFELISYVPDGPPTTRYQKMIATLNNPGRRVNFEFDDKMEFVSVDVYDDVTGSNLSVPAEDASYWASSVMYNMIFYVSCQHAMIHTLHYLMTSAFQYVATDHNLEEMQAWAETYANNIQGKYTQVGQLLITDPAPIPPTAFVTPAAAVSVVAGTFALLTGPLGFGSSQQIRPLLEELLNDWGQNPSAKGWMDVMMGDLEIKEGGVLLQEFLKHYELIPDFAEEAAKALIKDDHHGEAEKDLKKYLRSCGGFKSSFKKYEDWIEVMALTGIVHGGTLSYSRALADNNVLRWRNIRSPIWDTGDMNLVFGALGTITGMQPERHVMGGGDFFPTGSKAKDIREILEKYDAKAQAIKDTYVFKLLAKAGLSDEKRAEFNEFGWIWTDYCPDGFDGKQLTMATYI